MDEENLTSSMWHSCTVTAKGERMKQNLSKKKEYWRQVWWVRAKESTASLKEKEMEKKEQRLGKKYKPMSRNLSLKFYLSIHLYNRYQNAHYVQGTELDTRGDTKVNQSDVYNKVMV